MQEAKTTLIIGASPDLIEMAKLLGREGEKIALLSRSEVHLQQYRERLTTRGVTTEIFPGDVTQSASVQEAFSHIAAWSPRLERVIYNVGMVSHESASEITSLGLHKVMDPNFFGFVNCLQLALPMFRQNGRGHAIAISSVRALDEVQPVAYAASKAALRIYISALRRELSNTEIHISEIFLGQKREANGWRDLVCEEIVSGILQVIELRPERFLIGEPSEIT